MKRLTDNQAAFIEYYLSHEPYDVTAAYVAVYGDRGDFRCNQQNASAVYCRVKDKIAKRQREILQEKGYNPETVALKLINMATAAKDDQYYTPQVQLKALDLLQKQLGLQQTKQKIDAEVNGTIQFIEDIPNDTN